MCELICFPIYNYKQNYKIHSIFNRMKKSNEKSNEKINFIYLTDKIDSIHLTYVQFNKRVFNFRFDLESIIGLFYRFQLVLTKLLPCTPLNMIFLSWRFLFFARNRKHIARNGIQYVYHNTHRNYNTICI